MNKQWWSLIFHESFHRIPTLKLVVIQRHYYTKNFTRHFEIGLGGGRDFKPRRLMPDINRGGHFLLTETVTVNLAKSIYRGGQPNATVSVNTLTEAVIL
jgi:hypothetical protein